MDMVARRAYEKRIITCALESLIFAGFSITVIQDEQIMLADSSDLHEAVAAFVASEEPYFKVKGLVNGHPSEGWVDFLGDDGLMVHASPHLGLEGVLKAANALVTAEGV